MENPSHFTLRQICHNLKYENRGCMLHIRMAFLCRLLGRCRMQRLVCVRGGPNQPLHRDPQWSIVLMQRLTAYTVFSRQHRRDANLTLWVGPTRREECPNLHPEPTLAKQIKKNVGVFTKSVPTLMFLYRRYNIIHARLIALYHTVVL
jgi:hypothetical protein